MENFVSKIRLSLLSLGIDFESMRQNGFTMGLGISGGADSVSLFMALCEILKEERIPLVCVTVNHHIRPDFETDRDMHFVENLCSQAKASGYDVSIDVYDLSNGEVKKALESRNGGLEDAARFVRYECFESSILKNNIKFFCLAHNAEDNLENILIRFFTGSTAGGIEDKRGKYIRPLMKISRTEIEKYLEEKKQSFCIDSTNLSDEYLRNKIRHKMIPLLNDLIPQWRQAVLSGDEKRKEDNLFIDKEASEVPFSADLTEPGKEALWSRVLMREMNKVGVKERIPLAFIKEVLWEVRKSIDSKKGFEMRFSNASIVFIPSQNNEKTESKLFVKTYEKKQTDSGFFDIIEKNGEYYFPFGKVTVKKSNSETINEKGICLEFVGKDGWTQTVTINTDFPFVIRSPQLGEKKQRFVLDY